MTDHPFDTIAKAIEEQMALGHRCYQKFTCEKCGQRLTIDEPNIMYVSGSCDKCGHVTNIRERGCNYLLHMGLKGS